MLITAHTTVLSAVSSLTVFLDLFMELMEEQSKLKTWWIFIKELAVRRCLESQSYFSFRHVKEKTSSLVSSLSLRHSFKEKESWSAVASQKQLQVVRKKSTSTLCCPPNYTAVEKWITEYALETGHCIYLLSIIKASDNIRFTETSIWKSNFSRIFRKLL